MSTSSVGLPLGRSIPVTSATHRPLRELVRLLGRQVTARLIASFEANRPTTPEQMVAWVQGAHGSPSVRQALAVWIRAKLGL